MYVSLAQVSFLLWSRWQLLQRSSCHLLQRRNDTWKLGLFDSQNMRKTSSISPKRHWNDKTLYLKFGWKWLFFHFLLLVSQILYWQNFACQCAKMSFLLNLALLNISLFWEMILSSQRWNAVAEIAAQDWYWGTYPPLPYPPLAMPWWYLFTYILTFLGLFDPQNVRNTSSMSPANEMSWLGSFLVNTTTTTMTRMTRMI